MAGLRSLEELLVGNKEFVEVFFLFAENFLFLGRVFEF
jgi:hypothetical protein